MRRTGLLGITAALLMLVLSCRAERAQERANTAPSAPGSGLASSPLQLEPLTAGSWRIELPVEGFGPAVVAVPLGARQPRPVVIALHGDSDHPDWQCGAWNGIAERHAFVLCPRGVRRPGSTADGQRFTYGSAAETVKEVRAALKALKRRFRAHVSAGPVVLAGQSRGAELAVTLLRDEPAFFSRVVLIDGGWASWGATVADIFARGGGQRVIFVCTSEECRTAAPHHVLRTERAGAEARHVLAEGSSASVAAAVKDSMHWLVEGDGRWAGLYRRSGAPLEAIRPPAPPAASSSSRR